ncbi:saccharopine dehydrogenase NADP-binding domain-containing protein [Thermogutta sp.]|uniref:saccharopine dehydrogenase family protein n=1 Tax=Thermogutta sp. TaxID=1962930 RepID=UPI0032207AE2
MFPATKWMIYGATGYTGQRIASEAVKRGLRPILAGRNLSRLASLGQQLECPTRVFDLSSVERVLPNIGDCKCVLNCAGPFAETASSLVSACLRTGCHYLDITGEIDVIEHIAARHEEAVCRDVALIPAVGFDVVPTDTLAVHLKKAMPEAETLLLAFTSTGSLSPGTAKTMWQVIQKGGRIRKNGRLRSVPLAWKCRRIPFPSGRRWAALVPWGDVASAWYSTGIPNIEVYLAMPRSAIALLKLAQPMIARLASASSGANVEKIIRAILRLPPAGVGDGVDTLRSPQGALLRHVELWGCVLDPQRHSITGTMMTPDGYDFTVVAALAAVERVLKEEVAPGFATPTQAFGTDFALDLPGVTLSLEESPNRRSLEVQCEVTDVRM